MAGLLLVTTACTAPPSEVAETPDGIASFYGDEFAGRTTANGETYDPEALTAAHRTLDFDTEVRVTRVDTGASVVVRINDRGPFVDGRVIDLSRRAAREINMIDDGLAEVTLEIVNGSNDQDASSTNGGASSW